MGCSRMGLHDAEYCKKKGVIKDGEDPYAVAAAQLAKDEVDVLHTIEGDTGGAELFAYMQRNGQKTRVLGLPKTIDNDIFPVRQTLGALTAADKSARYFANVVSECTANPRMLIIHEIMGRKNGWLTAATADIYRRLLSTKSYVNGIGVTKARYDAHAVFIPEVPIDIQAEANRLKQVMNANDCVNIFMSEGAGLKAIEAEMSRGGEKVNLDDINPGEWFAKTFSAMIGAEKVLVQKSGYYARASAADAEDLRLIKSCTDFAVDSALRGESGIIGHDEENCNVLRAIEFERIKGEKPFNTSLGWFQEMLAKIGQKIEYGAGHRRIEVSEEDASKVKVRINVATRRTSGMFR